MDAMILAAGHGTRLRPLTDSVPKALVEVGGAPMLERVAERLIDSGADRLIVNTHYLGSQVEQALDASGFWGVEGFVSREEPDILDTGGGLLQASRYFRGEAPFFLHNVDILCDADLRAMYADAVESGAIATLAVMERDSSRYLLFDSRGLCGHGNEATGVERLARTPVGDSVRLGFCGIHVISPEIFGRITESGAFSIITLYMRLAAEGYTIRPWRIDSGEAAARWMDIGTHEKLDEANRLW